MALSPVEQRRIASLEAKIAALERLTRPASGIGQGSSTLFGALNIRSTQLGFAAELTSTFNATTGYDWKRLALDTTGSITLTNPAIQLTGNRAYSIDGSTTLASGTKGWLEPSPESSGYLFVVSNVSTSPDCGPGCGWVAGLIGTSCPETIGDCLRVTILSADGHCGCLDTGQTFTLSYSGGIWTTTDTFSGCDSTFTIEFDPNGCSGPCLTLTGSGSGGTTYELTLDCCGDNYAIFSGPGVVSADNICSDPPVTTGPSDNVFRIKVEWVLCSNPDWDGAGYYCVGDPDCTDPGATFECRYFATDPGPCFEICSGPHATLDDCETACSLPPPPPPPPPVTVACCPDPIPGRLWVTITGCGCLNGLVFYVDYDSGAAKWIGDATTGYVGSCITAGTISGVDYPRIEVGCSTGPEWGVLSTCTENSGTTYGCCFDGATGTGGSYSCDPVYGEWTDVEVNSTGLISNCCGDLGGTINIILSETPP